MAGPWFDEQIFAVLFNTIGGVFGGIVGTLGGLAGWLAPQGRARGLIYALWGVFTVVGLASLGFGLYALAAGQPYGIWYFPTLAGGSVSFLLTALFPVVRKRYAEADARRMQAEAIRRA